MNLFSPWQKSPYFCRNDGVVRHCLCHRPWSSGTRASAMRPFATSWAMLGALGFVKFELEGGHVLCCQSWPTVARSSAMHLLSTSWAMPGALGFVKLELGVGAVNLYSPQQK